MNENGLKPFSNYTEINTVMGTFRNRKYRS